MCLYPRLIFNKRYSVTKKNGGNIPPVNDLRKLYVPVGCGKCIECRRQKANNWRIRLYNELKESKGIFVTLTYSNEKFDELESKFGITEENEILKKTMRLFLERWRKKHKKSLKHWFISEKGEEKGRIHLHGIIFEVMDDKTLNEYWQYGNVFIGNRCDMCTINYITKYITKFDNNNDDYMGIVLCSPGIGKNGMDRTRNKFRYEDTNDNYRLKDGTLLQLPIYYRNKLFTEEQRQMLWTYKLDEGIRYIDGIKVDTKEKSPKEICEMLKERQDYDKQLFKSKIKHNMMRYKRNLEEIEKLTERFRNCRKSRSLR